MSRPLAPHAFEGALPFPAAAAPRPRLTIGLVNNMPDAALAATERQFGALLRDARPDLDVDLKLFSFANIERGERAREHMRGAYADAATLPLAGLDGLIVTGAEPRAAELADEPYWDEFACLADWTEAVGVPVLWSCLAAHAAVLHQAGVRRHRLPAKLSGVFAAGAAGDDPLTAAAPRRLFTPHSRLNGLAEPELALAGYRMLTRSPVARVDSFVRRDGALQLFLQGHPEYDADTLKREYLRDVGRFLRGERPDHPPIPRGYFDAAVEADLTRLADRGRRSRQPTLAEAYAQRLATVAPAPVWRTAGAWLVGEWLDEVSRPASGQARSQGLAAAG